MRRHFARIAAAFSVVLALGNASPAAADWLFISQAGLAHLDEIRKAIEPATIYEAAPGAQSRWYVRGIVSKVTGPAAARPAQQAAPATITEAELRALIRSGATFGTGIDPATRLEVIAFGPEAVLRSAPIELPASWFTIVPEFDAVRDVRRAFGNFDEAFGVPAGHRRFVEHFIAAIDPGGALGLMRRPTSSAAPTSKPFEAGDLLRAVSVARAREGERPALVAEQAPRLMEYETNVGIPGGQMHGVEWLRSVAIARRYLLDRVEPGFANAVVGGLQALLRLLTLEPGRFAPMSAPESGLDDLNGVGVGVLLQLLEWARVSPGDAFPDYDGYAVFEAVSQAQAQLNGVLDVASTETTERVRAAVQAQIDAAGAAPTRRDHRLLPDSSGRDPQLPVDPSEVAIVALEILHESDAICFAPVSLVPQLVGVLLDYETTVLYPTPRSGDRVRLRPKGRELLDLLLTQPRAADARTRAACDRAAEAARDHLLLILEIGNRGRRLAALQALRRSGWATRARLEEIAASMFGHVARLYLDGREQPLPSDPIARTAHRDQLARLASQLQTDAEVLSAFLDLAQSSRPDLRAVAARVQQLMDDASTLGGPAERYVLERVSAFRKGA
jgi:hypothetical protein